MSTTPARTAKVRTAISNLMSALSAFEAAAAPPPLNGFDRLVGVDEIYLGLAGHDRYPSPAGGSLENLVQQTTTRLKNRLITCATIMDSISPARLALAARHTDPAYPVLRASDFGNFGVVYAVVQHLGKVTAGLYDTLPHDSPVRKYITAAETVEIGGGRCIVLAIDGHPPAVLELDAALMLTRRASSAVSSNQAQAEAIERQKEGDRRQREANDPMARVKLLEKKLNDLQVATPAV
jgi:hypothetical protein